MHKFVRFAAAGLALLLAGQPGISAQDAAADQLTVTIVGGDRAVLKARQRLRQEPVVQVEDQQHARVAGAIVSFLLPEQGPGATFLNGEHSLTVTTDAQGRAVAHGLRPNSLAGSYDLRVNVSLHGMTGHAVVHLENAAAAAGSHGYVVWIVIGAVAGGVAGGVLASRNGSTNKSSTQTITLTPGSGTVGAP